MGRYLIIIIFAVILFFAIKLLSQKKGAYLKFLAAVGIFALIVLIILFLFL